MLKDNSVRWKQTAAILAGALIVSVFVGLLATLVTPSGLSISYKDPRQYLASGLNFVSGNGLGTSVYSAHDDVVTWYPLSHFPPALSVIYGSVMAFGVAYEDAVTTVALIAWALLLASIGLLTYRLSADSWLSLLAMMLAGLTWPIANRYVGVGSEQLFLPVLLFTVILVSPLPPRRLSAAKYSSLVLSSALLLLTRYVGVFLFAALGLWWIVVRIPLCL